MYQTVWITLMRTTAVRMSLTSIQLKEMWHLQVTTQTPIYQYAVLKKEKKNIIIIILSIIF